ncbi:hypothetical protein [Streptomyces sp. NBC_00272]|uniref:hypothetical protein n=1 Tax=Streptomyces sp. NBC_00272 TaxID=2975698 RepID=UPI002E2B15A3|nr:hypothetical protein [Streptomyces sp. NBC_00272]
MASYTSAYLGQIVADYQANVEPLLLSEGATTPATQKAGHAFCSRWLQPAIKAALDALKTVYAVREGNPAAIAEAIANLGR